MDKTLDDKIKDLNELVKMLDSKGLYGAVKYALAAGGNTLRRTVVKLAKQTGWHNADRISKGVRRIIPKKLDGFVVTVNPKPSVGGEKGGYHLNRRGKWKPIAMWMNMGTGGDKRRGKTAPTNFMEKAEAAGVQKAIDAAGKAFEKAVIKKVNKIMGED